MSRILIAVLCLTGSTQLPGQKSSVSSGSETGFILEAGEHQLEDILVRAARFLGRNYLLPTDAPAVPGRRAAPGPAASLGTIQLQKKLILDAISCEEVVGQLAFHRGHLILPLDALRGIYEVLPFGAGRGNALFSRVEYLSPKEVERKARLRVLVGTSVVLEHMRSSDAAQHLRTMFGSSNGVGGGPLISAMNNDPTLTIRGFAGEVASVLRAIQEIDVPRPETPTLPNQSGQVRHLHQLLQAQANEVKLQNERIQALERLLGARQLEQRDSKEKKPPKQQSTAAKQH